LQNAFDANYLQIEIFLERAEMILQHPAANALRPRLLKLIKEFEKFSNLRETVEELKKFSINIENNK
jgi:hypothetical protein